LDDQEFTRKLFTPIPLDGIVYLSKTTWPISTVFRLYLENLNWVPNAQNASGPTPTESPVYQEFLDGVNALETLQDRGDVVFSMQEKSEKMGGDIPLVQVQAADMLEAAKNGYEYKLDAHKSTWSLYKKSTQPVLMVNPKALNTPEMQVIRNTFHLKRGVTEYIITQDALNPFSSTYPAEGVVNIDLETRSLLQALYYVSHGIEVPFEHEAQGLVTVTLDASGKPFDWHKVTNGLFRVRTSHNADPPNNAHVVIKYKGYWFYIDDADQATKSTFSLLMELARMELAGGVVKGPVLTLPVGSR
jgi:hypothetical protein